MDHERDEKDAAVLGGTTKYTKYTKRRRAICGGEVGFIRVIRG
jgi:hypothetical protein